MPILLPERQVHAFSSQLDFERGWPISSTATVTPLSWNDNGTWRTSPFTRPGTFQLGLTGIPWWGGGMPSGIVHVTGTAANPTLNVPATTTINVGATFNVMTGVTATCPAEGNIISRVTASPSSINTANPGVHSVLYTLTSAGVTRTARRIVIVSDGNFTHQGNYIIQAANFTRRVGTVDTANAQIISAAGARGWRINADRTVTAVTPTVVNNGGYRAAARNI